MLIKPRRAIGTADISDLSRNKVIKWQQKWYLYLIVTFGFLFPMAVAGLGWGDWKGGFFFAGAARLCFVHHVRPFARISSEPAANLAPLPPFSRPSASTRSLTGSARRRSTTSTRPATTSSPRSSRSARGTTTSITRCVLPPFAFLRALPLTLCSALVPHGLPQCHCLVSV